MLRRKQTLDRRDSDVIFNIPPYLIKPNPSLSRTEFRDTALCSLADSIRRYGMLQPLAVRLSESGRYELIAGERRLRAAVLLKMPTVPCVLVGDCDNFEYLSVVENLQRERLGIFDEARAIRRLYVRSGKSLEKTAALLSMGESEVSSKLRLTEFSRAEAQAVSRLGLCEKTAVRLLDIPSSVRFYAIKLSAEHSFSEETVIQLCQSLEGIESPTQEELERAVEELCRRTEEKAAPDGDTPSSDDNTVSESRRTKGVLRDLRAFENSLKRCTEMLGSAGYKTELEIGERDGATVYEVRVRRSNA